MTSSTSEQYPASENACRIALGQANQVQPKLPLLKILQAAGAQGETFTLKEVMHYLGQYIMVRQLYDKRQQHMVYCGGDQLGELLGLESFSVKDPSPVYDMLKRNLTSVTITDAAQTLALAKDQSVDNPSQDQLKQTSTEGSSDTEGAEDKSGAPALSTSQLNYGNYEDKDLIENLSKSKKPKLDLVFEEWDVAGLPWWFLGNLRNNYKSRSNGSTDIQTNQDIDTAIVSDTTDDLWFLNESASDQFNVAVKVETVDCEEVGKESEKKLIEVTCTDDLEDSQCLSDDTDVEAASEDCWQCTKCKKFNSPVKRYCYRCWALRKDWYSDCPKLAHSLSLSTIDTIQGKKDDEGIDVPDCRRTVSAPVCRPKDLYTEDCESHVDPGSSMESLGLAQECKDQEPQMHFGEHKKEEKVECQENIKNLLNPCLLCQKRPRDGNIVHGRSAHLVACFKCAKMLKKGRLPCPVCKKQIQMVIRIFMG
ncbi:protein Mdm4 isoform X1 [Dermochelys coriacea]|uniref:protein Mdm4 isoform X1 n=1 Tax=Dermochelys coriacea TaxID=27794 RepID=UPI0018E75BE0|nr:protein Mdm4 isoform X1 [Dermochelys coriacea]